MKTLEVDIAPIVINRGEKQFTRQYLAETSFFNAEIMRYHEEALKIWRSVSHRYSNKEHELEVPYSLAESPKLYALDALCIASPLVTNKENLKPIAELFTVFYLMTHFFDDHVEHPDKFFSKFDFSSHGTINTQRGAAPFSFLLMSFSIIGDILSENKELSPEGKLRIQHAMYNRLAVQTRHFTTERNSNLNVDEVLQMKARHVNGKTLGVLADILAVFQSYDAETFNRLNDGLLYLGSLEQFTDDIRDISIDTALRNANLVVSAQSFGSEAGAKLLAKMYQKELSKCKSHLESFYDAKVMSAVLSLPFYPFMVNKQELELEK